MSRLSAEPGRKSPYANEVVWQRLVHELTQIAGRLNISVSAACPEDFHSF